MIVEYIFKPFIVGVAMGIVVLTALIVVLGVGIPLIMLIEKLTGKRILY